MAKTLEQLRNLNNEEYQRLVGLANGTAGGVNDRLTARIAKLPNLTPNQREDMFADALVASQQQAQAQAQAQGLRQRRVHSHSTGVNNLQSSGSILPQANMSNRAIVTCAIEGYVGIQMLIIAGNCVFTWRGLYLWLHVKNAPKWKDNIDVDLAIYLATFLGLMIWLLVFTKCCYWKDGHSLASTFSFSLMIRSTIILAFIEIWEETHDVSVVATCIYFLYALAETIICVFEICYNIPAEQKRKNLESYEIALRRLHNKYGSTDATTTTDEERGLLDGDDAIPDTANNNDTNAQNSALEIIHNQIQKQMIRMHCHS